MLEPVTFIAPLGTGQMDVEKSELQVEWWWWWWRRWCWWWDTAKGLLREETHKACDESSLGGTWNWTFRAERRYLDPKREHPTIAMVDHHLVYLNSHLEVYIVRHTHRAGKKTRSVLAQTPMSLFAVPMDARTRHFHRTVGYLENGCRKIRISSRMMMVMRRMMMMLMMMMMVMMTRHCEGAAAWRDSPGIWREFPLRGGALIVVVMWLQLGWFMNRGRAWNWTFIAERRYLDPKRGHPTIAMVDHHLVYLKSHLEVYCLTHASCGEKKHGQC